LALTARTAKNFNNTCHNTTSWVFIHDDNLIVLIDFKETMESIKEKKRKNITYQLIKNFFYRNLIERKKEQALCRHLE
jgi:adenylyl- and sulfurtransferase ThiI